MSLLPGWQERLDSAAARQDRRLVVPPVDLPLAASEVRVADTAVEALEALKVLQAAPLTALALALEVPQSAPGPAIALAGWAESGEVLPVVVLLAEGAEHEAVGQAFRRSLLLVGHDLRALLLDLWGAGVEADPLAVFDTRVAASALHLGQHHPRARQEPERSSTSGGEVRRRKELDDEREDCLSLESQCLEHGVTPMIPLKASGSIAGVDVRKLAARALWTLQLYILQQAALTRRGLQHHLFSIEFPFAVANARIEHRGLHVDAKSLQRLRSACQGIVARQENVLRDFGVDEPGSGEALRRAVGTPLPSLADDALKREEGSHPAIRAFRIRRRHLVLARQPWPIGPDGRVHPEHRQLAAATGRNGCKNPNVAGLPRALRPVVTAPAGRGLMEFDYAQIEVGVAAAEHGDVDLLAAYNEGDVYALAAQRFFADELTEEARALSPLEFRRQFPERRDSMKPVVLSVLYGGGARTVACQLGIGEAKAEAAIRRFLSLFPRLARGLEEHEAYGLARGHASIVGGLRRAVVAGAPGGWTRNGLRNTPIQGGAAVVFKKAIVEIDRAFRRTDCWIVLPLHDGLLVECPLEELDRVEERVKRAMEDAVRYFYPALDPRIEVNRANPHCWNKDGRGDSLERLFRDLSFESAPGGANSQDEPSTRRDAGA